MAKKKVSNGLPAISVLSESRQELYHLQESCRELGASHNGLEEMLGSTNHSLVELTEAVDSLDDTIGKCLEFVKQHASRMDDWEVRLAALEDARDAN